MIFEDTKRYTAIRNVHNTVVTIAGETDATDEKGNSVTLDEALITAEVTRLQAEYDANQYQRDRATAYPSLQDQADMQFHDLANGTTTWLDAIQAVKDAYPKPI